MGVAYKFDSMNSLRGFKTVFTTIGVIYVLLASSALASGPNFLLGFGVPESVVAEPVLQDIFMFFYQLMAVVGLLTVLFGHATAEGKAQWLVASAFCVANIVAALRDLVTSDSRFGNQLYKGDKTLVFVYISVAFALAFGSLVVGGLLSRGRRPIEARGTPNLQA